MEWKKEYETKNAVIDAQHKQLFACFNEFEKAIKVGLKKADLQKILNKTQLYAARHFAMEEKYMKESDYPGLNKQLKAHAHFVALFSGLMKDFEVDGFSPALVNTFNNELSGWLKKHVAGLDQIFGKYHKSLSNKKKIN